ncbi:MAG: calcium/sodium antiporter [Dorea sp.]|nr:calcium/sodium antiporter [Dorea sp.]
MTLLIQLALLVVGFVLLVKGADWFVEGAAGIADKLGVPQLVIGLTIVAMGTSLPEAAVSLSSALKGSAEIAVGNVLGSNIMNILLILGITSLITPLAIKASTIKYEIPFVIVISILFSVLGLSDGAIKRFDGVILWVFFLLYLGYLLYMTKHGEDMIEEAEINKNAYMRRLVMLVIVGAGLIVYGSNLTVDAASEIAYLFGMSKRWVGLTIVAFGTSLPELATCVTAALKKNADLAIGNIVGSNIFNILFVIGTSALITPVAYQADFLLDSILAVGVVVLLWLLVINKDRHLKRWGGAIMLAAYIGYFIYLL